MRHIFNPVGPVDGNLEFLNLTKARRNNWDQSQAARFLSITRNTLIYLMQKFGLSLTEAEDDKSSAALTNEA